MPIIVIGNRDEHAPDIEETKHPAAECDDHTMPELPPDELDKLSRWIAEELGRQFDRHNSWRQRDKTKSFALHVATAVLSAIVTVLIGLHVSDWTRPLLTNIALGIGAVVTVLAGTETYFNHRDLWILRVRTLVRLEELKRQFDYQSLKSTLTVEDLDRYAASLDDILRRDHSAWIQMRSADHSDHRPGEPGNREPVS